MGESIVLSFSMDLGDTLGVRFGFLWHSIPWIIVYITFPILQWLALVWCSWDELFNVVTHYYISIPACSSIFYYIHSSFVLSLLVFFYPHRTSSRFMNNEFFWCTSPIVWRYSFGCRLSHLAHMILWYLALHTRVWHLVIGYLAFVSHHFIHLSPLAYITVRVVRPPWGHEILCLLRHGSFGQAPSTNWVQDVDRFPLLQGISRITYCLSIQFACIRSMIRGRWYRELGPLRAPLLDALTCSY